MVITPEFILTSGNFAEVEADVLVIGTVQGADGLELLPGTEDVATAFNGELLDLLTAIGAKGKPAEAIKLPSAGKVGAPVVLAVGVGKSDTEGHFSADQIRRCAGVAARNLTGMENIATTLSRIDLSATVEGIALGAYQFTAYKSEPSKLISTVLLASDGKGADSQLQNTVTAASAIAEAVNLARDFVNTPPNDLYPAAFADRAATLAKSAGLDVEVFDEKALHKGGFGGILGVGSGSTREPRLVKLEYRGPQADKKVALVGKGITFDTGGISIKPAAGMEEMTSDMSGAAAVLATMVLASKLRYPLHITAFLPMAENMVSGSAYRPGDVLRMYNGTTVEVTNTDAEGRLILADAIALACEGNPDYLVEVSTLTGGQLIALGKRISGVMGSDDFRDRVARIARATGENGWAMPFAEELRPDFDSKLADLINLPSHRNATMLAAAMFLREFITDGLPWAHMDIAGPAYNSGSPWGYTPKGATGVPVRTLAAVLADIAAKG